MAKLVDPTCGEIRELSAGVIKRAVETVHSRQSEWQLERGAEGYKNLSDCPPENVRGQRIWLLGFIAQGLELERQKLMGP